MVKLQYEKCHVGEQCKKGNKEELKIVMGKAKIGANSWLHVDMSLAKKLKPNCPEVFLVPNINFDFRN